MSQPLADLLRPKDLDDVVGQQHILGKNRALRKIIESKHIPNMIFYGPSGTGKTTIANIIASLTDMTLYKVNATSASSADIKDIIGKINTLEGQNGILLYIDEIQYFSKKQQQLLLEYIENGDITLIASTTENPYFYVYNALISRSTIFEFKPVPSYEIEKAITRAIHYMADLKQNKVSLEDGLVKYLATICGGDVRKAINSVELMFDICNHYDQTYFLTMSDARQIGQRSQMRYDRDGDEHYDTLSAFHKSIRGSDPDGAIFYLAKLLEAGDLLSPCRRLLAVASEDIGLAYPQAIVITKNCVDSALQLGLPEGRLPLAEAVIFLCTCPKSNSAAMAIDNALATIKEGKGIKVPTHLLDAHYAGSEKLGHGIEYKYPHDYPSHYVKQQYLPDDIKNIKFYSYQDNKIEQAAKAYWDLIKK
jgi:putative ATPase